MPLFPVEYSSLSTKALLQLVLSNYTIAADSTITYIKRGFNDTYLIKSTNNKYILRVYKLTNRNFESVETELKLINHLKENNVSVSFPITDKHSKLIHAIQAPEGERYAVLFSYAEGEQIRKLSIEQAYLLGVETGKIHTLTKNKSFGITAHNYSIEHQFELTLTTLKPVLIEYPEQYTYLLELKTDFINTFNSIDKYELATGICHGDLQAENFHITTTNQFTFFYLLNKLGNLLSRP